MAAALLASMVAMVIYYFARYRHEVFRENLLPRRGLRLAAVRGRRTALGRFPAAIVLLALIALGFLLRHLHDGE